MQVRTNDYRPYGKQYNGRIYRLSRIYTNNLISIISRKVTIAVISLSFLFLFFSILMIVFAAPEEGLEEQFYKIQGPEVYFDIVPEDINDLQVQTYLNSTFEVVYNVTNVGHNETEPFIFVMPPNSNWTVFWEMEKDTLAPGETMKVTVHVWVPGNIWDFQKFDSGDYESPDPKRSFEERDVGQGSSIPIPDRGEGGFSGLTSPEQLYLGSYMLDNMFSRLMLVFAVPGDVDLFSAVDNGILDQRVSSIGTVISLEKDEPALLENRFEGIPNMSFDTSFDIMIPEAEEDPIRIGMTAQDSTSFDVLVKNTGNRTIRVKLEAFQMEINDWDWSVEIYPMLDHENNPEGDIPPGGEMIYQVRIFSGYTQNKIPYNIELIGTETTMWEYKESSAKLVVVEIIGPPEVKEIQNEFFDIFWGGEFHYERFLWLILLTAVAGSGLIARDLKNNTLTLYLSRPITWVDYTLGKFLAISTVLSTITLFPALLIFATKMAFKDEPFSYVIDHLWLLGGMLLSYVIVIVIFSSIALALSSLTKRGIFAGVGIFAYFILTPLVSDLMVGIFENDYLKLFNINLIMKNMLMPLFGLKYSSDSMGFGYHLLVLEAVLLLVLSWAILFFRFHNREVAK